MKKEKEKIKVTDKRIFDDKGDVKKEFKRKKSPKASAKKSTKTAQKRETKKVEEKTEHTTQQTTPVTLDFNSFILSLSTSAYIYLGIIEDPVSKEKMLNLDAAKQMIDILGMLREKTKGNLAENEEKLLDDILYEIRMQYLNISNA